MTPRTGWLFIFASFFKERWRLWRMKRRRSGWSGGTRKRLRYAG